MHIIGSSTRLAMFALVLPATPFVGATVAGAQTISNQGVAQRARPEYDPIGVDIGGLTLFPSITASLEATDNYRATPTNKQGDVYTVIQPEVLVRSDWSRHRLEARAYASPSVHFNLPDENVTQFGASAAGTYDVSRMTSFRADLSAARFVESRSSLGAFRGTAEPVRYDLFRAGIAASQSFNDFTLTANAGSERRNFRDVRLAAGAGTVDQDFRDVRFLTFGGSAQYDLRNGIGLIVSGQYDRARYDFRPGSPGFVPGVSLDRQSSGYTLQGGVTLELSRLVFGTIQAGYMNRNYRDLRLRDLNGLSYSADILWNVTQLTSIRLRAARSVEESSSTQIAGNRRNDLRIGVDHELYRNILLNGDVGYGSFRPLGPGVGGREFSVGAGARYLINRRFTLSGGGRYSERTSSSPFLRFRALSANAALRFAL
jgi:hypothetical protein